MDIAELINFLQEKMAKEPHLFLFREDEPKVTDEEIRQAEMRLAANLPAAFKLFQKEFGGGTFAFGELFSLSPASDYFVFRQNFVPGNFFPISDDGTGGYYAFKKTGNHFTDTIYYLDCESENALYQGTNHDFISFFLWSAFNI